MIAETSLFPSISNVSIIYPRSGDLTMSHYLDRNLHSCARESDMSGQSTHDAGELRKLIQREPSFKGDLCIPLDHLRLENIFRGPSCICKGHLQASRNSTHKPLFRPHPRRSPSKLYPLNSGSSQRHRLGKSPNFP